MAICCNMHARTHAHPWRLLLFFLGTMASAASFVRSGAMRVLRREDRGQETSNGHQQLAFHARTARRGLCQDLTAGRGMVEPAHSALASSSFSSYQDSCRRPVTDPQQRLIILCLISPRAPSYGRCTVYCQLSICHDVTILQH